MIDVQGMEESYIINGFKAALMKIIPPTFDDFTASGINDLLFGKKCNFFVVKNNERKDTLHAIEEVI